ncbi:hypothetical protein V491_06324 [Pseudogymnoascus sp. VKM F-3775]|nr:hypothetical protein V491_06324 [Pseudogymnoascus sp. VKM F-3775]
MPSHVSTSFISPISQALIVSSSDGYQDLDILPQRLTWPYNQSSIFTALPTNTGAHLDNNNNQASNSSTEALRSPHGDDQEHVSPLDETPDSVSENVKERLINLFYTYFYPSHPFLLPKHLFSHRGYPTYLMAVVYFIGSHHSSSISRDLLRASTARVLADDTQKTEFMVQARLLFSIALLGRNELEESEAMFAQAINLALELGMNQASFATLHGRQNTVEEESLRRTWWELYIVDGYIAAFLQKPRFNSPAIDSRVGLPGEELDYLNGTCTGPSFSIAQFNARLFSNEETVFSSFCYRIDAMRILARVLALTDAHLVHHDDIQAVDNALTAWSHHLPLEKADIINTFGTVDEMLFQAHLIIQHATSLLHFPRSNIYTTLAAVPEITGGHKDPIPSSPTFTQHTHAIKAIEASKHTSNLAALRISVHNYSPVLSNALVFGVVIQLSTCFMQNDRFLERNRDRVALMIGILKSLSRAWPSSQHSLQQIRNVAAEVFHVGGIAEGAIQDSFQPTVSYQNVGDVSDLANDTAWLACNSIGTLPTPL